nr:hypothetical protein [Tanacetum cinerariifolium]
LIKKKDQMRIDEENAKKLEAKKQKAARLSRAQQDEEANNLVKGKQEKDKIRTKPDKNGKREKAWQ